MYHVVIVSQDIYIYAVSCEAQSNAMKPTTQWWTPIADWAVLKSEPEDELEDTVAPKACVVILYIRRPRVCGIDIFCIYLAHDAQCEM